MHAPPWCSGWWTSSSASASSAFRRSRPRATWSTLLRREGFTVDTGVAGMPTAWVARWGQGAPVIALGLRHRRRSLRLRRCRASPAGCRWWPARRVTARGTTRGRRSTSRRRSRSSGSWSASKLPGTLVLWPGVAEEQLGGEAIPGARRGLPRRGRGRSSVTWAPSSAPRGARPGDRDSCLGALPVPRQGGACRRAALAGAERAGRGGADGHRVELPARAPAAEAALALRHRRRRRSAQRGTPDARRPGTTCGSWTTRASRRLWAVADSVAEGAALMTGTTLLPTRVLGAAWPRHYNRPVAEALDANIKRVGMPAWTDRGPGVRPSGAAHGGAARLRAQDDGGFARSTRSIPARNLGGASDDIGDVSWTRAHGGAATIPPTSADCRVITGPARWRWRRRSRTRGRWPAPRPPR